MKGILITSEDCGPCEALREQFVKEIASGEIKEVNLENDGDEAINLIEKYNAGIPSLLILNNADELIISI